VSGIAGGWGCLQLVEWASQQVVNGLEGGVVW
jgi:hypothetical protein